MWKLLERCSQVLFCTPVSEDFNARSPSKKQRILYYSATVFDAIDVVDALLDTLAAIRFLQQGRTEQGLMLLAGIALARAIAAKGKHVLLHGKGLLWVPFCLNADAYMTNLSVDTQLNLRRLYAILFTEIAMFLFEDSVIVSIWAFKDGFDKNDIYDQLNGWVTLLSTFIGCSMLIIAVALSLRHWTWKQTFFGVAHQAISSLLFCGLFGIVFLFLLVLMFTGFQIIARDRVSQFDRDTEGNFFLLVCASWTMATYFSCKIRSQAVQPRRLANDEPSENTVHDVEVDADAECVDDPPTETTISDDNAVPIVQAILIDDPPQTRFDTNGPS